MTTKTKNTADTLEDIRTAIFSLAYQAETEREHGKSVRAGELELALTRLTQGYACITGFSAEAQELLTQAKRAAQLRVYGG